MHAVDKGQINQRLVTAAAALKSRRGGTAFLRASVKFDLTGDGIILPDGNMVLAVPPARFSS